MNLSYYQSKYPNYKMLIAIIMPVILMVIIAIIYHAWANAVLINYVNIVTSMLVVIAMQKEKTKRNN